MKWFVLLILFSEFAQAITEKQLIEKYGKERVVNFISEKTGGKITIVFNGEIRSAHKPSPDYITARTIKIDLKQIGSSANKVDFFFTKILKDKKEKVAKEKQRLIDLENKRRLRKKARLLAEEKERLRPKDKYDLAVAKAVNRGLEIQAKNERRLARERRYQKKPSKIRNSTNNRWFDGGNMHKSTVIKWRAASYQNKLATVGDWLASTKWKGHLNRPKDFYALKKKSIMLVNAINEVSKADKKGTMKVREIAAAIITMSNDLGPY